MAAGEFRELTPEQQEGLAAFLRGERDPVQPKRKGGGGFFGRLGRVLTGVGGAMQAPFGLVKDLAIAPWKDGEEFDGFFNTIFRRTVSRGGETFENLIGPDRGLGAVIGGLPESVRAPGRVVAEPVLAGLETAYREGVAEPVSTAVTAASLSDRDRGNLLGFGGLLDPDTWTTAYGIAQNRSPGQAIALAFGTRDILDQEEVARFSATDAYDIWSGLWDATLRLTLDPTVIGGKAAGAARARHLVRSIRSQDDINRAMSSKRVLAFRDRVQEMSAAEIRDTYFAGHRHGGVISTVLKETPPDQLDFTIRALMGDREALRALSVESAALANRVARIQSDEAVLLSLSEQGFEIANSQARLGALTAEIDELYPEAVRLERMQAAAATVRTVPRETLGRRFARSDFYQQSPLAAPLRTFEKLPHRYLNLHDQSGDVQVARMLKMSDLPVERQDELRGAYMAAVSPGQRRHALLRAENDAVRSVAERAGMTVTEIDELLAQASRGRSRAEQVLRSRSYDADGKGRIRFADPDSGEVTEIAVPLWVTQEVNVLPIVDMAEVQRVASRIGRFRLRHPSTDIPTDLLNSFYRVWRPSVLLRAGWPMRVVADEQLRIMAKIGTLANAHNLGRVARDLGRRTRGRLARESDQTSIYSDVFAYRGFTFDGPFGAPGDAENLYRALNSSRGAWDVLTGKTETGLLKDLRGTGEWKTILPHEPGHAEAWTHALNKQIGLDAAGKQLLGGASVDDVVRWMETTAAGRAYVRRLPERASDLRAWVEDMADQVERYTLDSDEIRALAARGKVTADDLARLAPDAAQRPNVHGEALGQSFGTSPTVRLLSHITDKGYRALGSLPTDVLSRNPFFDHMYRAEVRRLVDLLDDSELTTTMLDDIAAKAREYALGESKTLLYDLADRSRLAEMLRFFAPFYQAWEEVITRWAGLAVENPAFAARARLVWNSPEKAGIVTDENGAIVDENGRARDPVTGKIIGTAGEERFLTFPLPEWASDVPGLRGLESQGRIRFNKRSFNIALTGSPGLGPPVQIAANEIAKARPDLEETLRFILPYGSTQETMDLLLPATARRLRTRVAGEEDRVFRNTALRIYFDKVVDYNLGKREDRPTWQEAEREAQSLYNVRFWVSFISPAAPTFQSPYQVYIDAYRQLRERDPETADEVFLETYGPEFFPLTQSLSRSMDGVPPTLEGHAARKRYRDLIEKYPDLGGLIVGAEGAGEFSRAVYDAQLSTAVRPGSGTKQREAFDFETASRQPDVRLGWIKYTRLMDLIEATRVQRGLPNLQVKAADDLRQIKRAVIDKLAAEHPAWFEEFGTFDRNAWQKRLAGFREIVSDPRLSGRDDIRGLAQYLEAREAVLKVLSQRESTTITARANQDLALAWEAIKGRLLERNLAFSQLYFRWLESDPMALDTMRKAA